MEREVSSSADQLAAFISPAIVLALLVFVDGDDLLDDVDSEAGATLRK